MKLTIKTKNLDLTEKLKKLVKERVEKVKKMVDSFQSSAELLVEVKKETNRHKKGDIFLVEIIVHLPGKKLVAKLHGENLNKLVTLVRDEFKRELVKHKTKVVKNPIKKAKKNSPKR